MLSNYQRLAKFIVSLFSLPSQHIKTVFLYASIKDLFAEPADVFKKIDF